MIVLAFAIQLAVQEPRSEVAVSQSKLDVMSDACHAPREWLRHEGGDAVRFMQSRTANYKKVECVFQQMRSSLLSMNLGFVGNELVPEQN